MERQESFLIKRFPLIVLFYFIAFFIIRVYIGGALERDEAEQMLLFNNFSFGYGTQPPLYSWIEQIFFYIFGNSIVALALLKNILLFTAYIFIYKSTYILTKSKTLSVISLASMFMIPSCAWECQRDLTHTVLALTMGSITLYYTLYLREKEQASIFNYALLGGLVALSILSKYNLAILTIATLIAGLIDSRLRKLILDKKIFIAIAIAILTLLPHTFWLIDNISLAVDGTLKKLNIKDEFNIFLLFKKSIGALVEFFILYMIIYFIVFKDNIKNRGDSFIKYHQVVTLVLVITILTLLEATNLKSRWLIPLLFPSIIYFTTKLELESLNLKSINRFLYSSILFMGLIMVVYIARVEFPSLFHKNPRFNFPYREILEPIVREDFNKTIYTSSLTGGNIRYLYPNLDIKILKDLNISEGSLIILDKDNRALKPTLEIDLNITFKEFNSSYRNSEDLFRLYVGEVKR